MSQEPEIIEIQEDINDELDAALAENPVCVSPQTTKLPSTIQVKECNESLISQVLAGKSPEYRSAVLRIAYQTGVEKNDPLFAVLLATGQLELLLYQKPKQIKHLFQQWRKNWRKDLSETEAILSQEREQIRLLIDETQKTLDLQTKAALNVQKRNISKTVQELVRKAAFEKVAYDAWALVCAGFVLLGAMGLGIILGLAIPLFAKQPELDPTGPRQLTLEEVNALDWGLSETGEFARLNPEVIEWAKSKEGQYAHQFMQWNQALMSGKGQRICEQEAEKLAVTLKVEGKNAQSGFCTLWVRPPEERNFLK